MSHVTTMELEVYDLNALKDACKMIGLELVMNQTTFRSYQTGKCLHAIRIPGDSRAYEMGVAANASGDGYVILKDFWNRGYGLQDKVGNNGGLLMQSYAIARAKREALKLGHRTEVKRRQNGNLYLRAY